MISRCIGFDSCRYNGEMVADRFVESLAPHVEFFTVCPEVEIGLGTPRDPVRVVKAGGELQLIQPSTGLDLTERMNKFSARFLSGLSDIDGFLLKGRSPSCGVLDAKYYGSSDKGPALGKAAGLFGRAVMEKFRDAAIEDEGRLTNLQIREHYLTRIFAFAGLRALQRASSMKALVDFHAAHKLLLMSYNQSKMRELGRIVANSGRADTPAVLARYAATFRQALSRQPRHVSSINVLMHAQGYFKNQLSAREKSHFNELLGQYRAGKLPLSSAVSVMNSWALRFENDYLLQQMFFQRFPEDLLDSNDSGKGRDGAPRSA